MKFIIINRNKGQYSLYDGYHEWPEQLDNINSRRFKRNFDQAKYQKLQVYWELNKYIGPASERGYQFSVLPGEITKPFVMPEITIKTVSDYLMNITAIDDEYIPEEGDEIRIYLDYYYKEIKEVKRPNINVDSITLLYKEGIWKEGQYHWETDETAFLMNGMIIT